MSRVVLIDSVQYPGQFITIFGLRGTVVGYHKITGPGSSKQEWEIPVVGGNQIVLKNKSTETCESVGPEVEGGLVVGSSTPLALRLIPVAGGWYQIASMDGKLIWLLTSGEDEARITWQTTPYEGKDAQWNLEPVT